MVTIKSKREIELMRQVCKVVALTYEELEKNIKILENAINEKEKNKANLIKLYTMNKITDDEFEKIKNEYQDEIMDYKSQLIQLKVNRDANETGKNQQKIKI